VKAAAFRDRECIEIVDVPEPEVGPGQVKVRVGWSAICGSDKGLWMNPGPKPGVQGHEAAGTIVDVGDGVSRERMGEKIVVYDVIGCGKCGFCERSEYTRCPNRIGGVGGGFGEYLVAPERNALPLADGVGLERGCVMSDCLCTPFKAADLVGVSEGEWVAVFGGGPIGLNAVQSVCALGARAVHVEPIAYRREAGQRLGAAVSVDPEAEDPVEAIRSATGGGACRVMECTGVEEAQRAALSSVAPGGSVVFVGENNSGLPVNVSEDLIRRDIRVMGSWYFFPHHLDRATVLLREGKLDPLRVVSHRVTLDTLAEGFAAFCERKDDCTKVIIEMPAPG